MTLTGFLLIVVTLWALAYVRAKAVTWLILPAVLLLALGLSDQLCGLPLFILWLLYLTGAGLYAMPGQRQRWISGPLLRQFRKVMPR